jgi:hypothetical protein
MRRDAAAVRVTPAARSGRILALIAATIAAGCFEYSPHDLPTDSADRDVNWKSLERLTATPVPDRLRFAVVGDTQRYFDDARDFVSAVASRDDVAFVVQLGDFTHYGLRFEYEVMNRVFRGLPVPYFVVPGNHDLIGNGRAIFEHVFGPLEFAFTYGRFRFVLLDTNGREAGFAPDVPDLEWLSAQLAPTGAHDQAFVFGHAGPNGEDFTPSLRAAFPAVLRDAGVTLSIHAHGHNFEMYEADGVTFLAADSVDHRNYVIVTALPGGGFDLERVFF